MNLKVYVLICKIWKLWGLNWNPLNYKVKFVNYETIKFKGKSKKNKKPL